METIRAHSHFHAGHRQLDYEGKCAWVHGHTWRGRFTVRAERFPRIEKLDMGVDFGALKGIFKFLDHKMLISERDTLFQQPEVFDPQGIVVMPGENPSVENVALYCLNEAVELLAKLFPGEGIDYHIEVEIQETDNNFYIMDRQVTI